MRMDSTAFRRFSDQAYQQIFYPNNYIDGGGSFSQQRFHKSSDKILTDRYKSSV